MKIAYIMYNYRTPSEVWLWRQINFLKDNISFIAAIDSPDKRWDGAIPVIRLANNSLLNRALQKFGFKKRRSLKDIYTKTLFKALESHHVDLIFVNYLSFAHVLRDVLMSAEIPIVVQTHGYDITWNLQSRETNLPVYDESYLEFAREISKKGILLANSYFSKENITKIGVNPDRVIVKYFGVPDELQMRVVYDHEPPLRILFLGRLIEFKGPDLVIRAFEIAMNNGLDAELIIAGGGNMESVCRSLRERSKYKARIKILGPVTIDQGRALRLSSDIFTAHNCQSRTTNQVEAFGVSIIEAMSAGLPVVTGKSGGVVETVVDGETGYLVSPGDIEEHANKLVELGNDPQLRRRMGQNAQTRAKEVFSIEGERHCLLDVFTKAMQI